jgi:uncharacterized protein
MLGGGGAILAVPMLVYVARIEVKSAIATSLFCVGVMSTVGTFVHGRSGNVRFRTGLLVGIAAMVAAYGGARLAHFVSGNVLLVVFAVLMVVSATTMLTRRTVPTSNTTTNVGLGRAIAIGAAIGTISGFVGAGGGFLLVPALAIFGRLAMREAIGTSLFIITLQSFAGFVGHLGDVRPDPTLMLLVTSASVAGSFVGASLNRRVRPDLLRQIFAWLVIVMGVGTLAGALAH